jgi:hypothetical protein
MYTKGESVTFYTSEYSHTGDAYELTEILDPDGDVICHVQEYEVEDLLSHLNRAR